MEKNDIQLRDDKNTSDKKFVWDTSAFVSLVRTNDIDEKCHCDCKNFMLDHEHDIHLFSATLWFEFQATLSRKKREGQKVLRDVYILNDRRLVYSIDENFLRKTSTLKLYEKFENLRGMDLIHACIAFIEKAHLVTLDNHFRNVADISIIYPNECFDKKR